MSIEIHHVAALSSDLQRTIKFYSGVLGLKYIKKALLFDGPQVGHFYWDERMDHFLTFYHCPNLSTNGTPSHSCGAVSFSVDRKGRLYWEQRLKFHAVRFRSQFDDTNDCHVICFNDPDGLPIKLVFAIVHNTYNLLKSEPQEFYRIRGFFGVELNTIKDNRIKFVFTEQLKMKMKQETRMKLRFFSNVKAGSIIDFNAAGIPMANGYGRIHHVALKMHDWDHFIRVQKSFPSENNRMIIKKHPNHYVSFYFWEDSGQLFELVGEMPVRVRNTSFNFKRRTPGRATYDA